MKKIVIKKLKNDETIVYYRVNNVNVQANIAKSNSEINIGVPGRDQTIAGI